MQNGELHLSEVVISHQLMCILWMSFRLQGGFLLFYFAPFRVSSCSTNFKYKNMDINFSKLPIIEDVCLRFPSAPFHVVLQKQYTNDMVVCNIPCFFRNKFNAVTLQPNRGPVCLRNTAGNFSFSDTM